MLKDLVTHLQRLGERAAADGHDHELLKVDLVVGVGAAVEDVHHRHGKHMSALTAQIAPQRQPLLGRGRMGRGKRDREDCVGAQP